MLLNRLKLNFLGFAPLSILAPALEPIEAYEALVYAIGANYTPFTVLKHVC